MGVRGSEDELRAPEIIVLGDSFAMGWGVEQAESFAALVGLETGRKVLNTGISSYATPREMRMLDRLDTSRLREIIIQYCDNDEYENRTFMKDGKIEIGSREGYERGQRYQEKHRQYFPGKYIWSAYAHWNRPIYVPDHRDHAAEARAFLFALQHEHHRDLRKVQVTVLELNSWNHNDDRFADALDAEKAKPGYPAYIHRLRTVRPARLLGPEGSYVLDDHLTPAGHRIVAREILRAP
jgi:hypothetical protein